MRLFKIISSLIAVMLAVTLSVTAETYPEYTIESPSGFVAAGEHTDKSDLAEILRMTADAVDKYFLDNNIIYFAADSQNRTQIKLSKIMDSFSEKVINFSYLEDDALLKLSDKLFPELEEKSKTETTVLNNNSLKFLKRSEAHKDSGGNYVATVYVTVVNGEKYQLSVLCEGESEQEIADTVFKTLKIHVIENDKKLPVIYSILIACGIILSAAVAIISLINIIKTKKEPS